MYDGVLGAIIQPGRVPGGDGEGWKFDSAEIESEFNEISSKKSALCAPMGLYLHVGNTVSTRCFQANKQTADKSPDCRL